jgi:ribulose-phosphate 3-epimerase
MRINSMVTICPTITVETPEDYRKQMELLEPFANRLHIDLADGDFAPRKLLGFDKIWWRGNRTIDVHIMYRYPIDHAEIILALNPRLVVIHAEAEGNFVNFADHLHSHGIEVGVAILPETRVDALEPVIGSIDHVLIFSGNLGYQGGSTADLSLLKKAIAVRRLKPTVEIGWDGGVNDQNAKEIAAAGVDVLNVGGFIQHAVDPAAAYATLKALVQ